jgi:hypothetical protein
MSAAPRSARRKRGCAGWRRRSLPQTGDAAQRAEAERLRREAEALERERRAAATTPGGASDAAVDHLRQRARALDQALDRQQRI